MWWARRFNRIVLIVLVVAVGRVPTSFADADDSLRPPTWLIAAMPREASQIVESILGASETGASWVTLADAVDQRHIVVVGVTGSDGAQHDGAVGRLETLLASVAGQEDPIWRLEERADLCLLPASAVRRQVHRIVRYEFPPLRMPRVERRLRNRLQHARATGSPHPYVVLQGSGGDRLTRIVILEPDDRPMDRRLASWAVRSDVFPGSLQGGVSPAVLAQIPGHLAHMLTGDLLLDPLEPLPAPTSPQATRQLPAGRDTGSSFATQPEGASPQHEARNPAQVSRRDPAVSDRTAQGAGATSAGVTSADSLRPIPVAPLPQPASRQGDADLVEPTPPLPPPTLDLEAVHSRVTSAVEGWARAWSSQRATDYFAAYASDFRPAGTSLARWRAERRARIQTPRVIDVRVAALDIQVVDPNRVRVIFEQAYQSDQYRDRVRKQLDFVRENGAFKIARELVLQVLGKP